MHPILILRSQQTRNRFLQPVFLLNHSFHHLSRALKKGTFGEKYLAKSLYWLRQSAKQDFPLGLHSAASALSRGKLGEQNYREAFDYRIRLFEIVDGKRVLPANLDGSVGRISYALLSFDAKDLAKAYELGRGVEQNSEKARHWYLRAAELGYPVPDDKPSETQDLNVP